MMVHPIYILLGILAFILFCYFASELINKKLFRVDSSNIGFIFIGLSCCAVGIYALMFVLAEVTSLIWSVIFCLVAFIMFWKAKKVADTKNLDMTPKV